MPNFILNPFYGKFDAIDSDAELAIYDARYLKLDQSTPQTITASPIFDNFNGTTTLVTATTDKKLGQLSIGTLTGDTAVIVPVNTFIVGFSKQITHATTAGFKHIPTGGSANQILKNSGASGTGAWGTVTETSGALAAITTINMSGNLTNSAGDILLATNKGLKINTTGLVLSYNGTDATYNTSGYHNFYQQVGISAAASGNFWLAIQGTSASVYGGAYIAQSFTGSISGGETRYNEINSKITSTSFAGNHTAVGWKNRTQLEHNDGGYDHEIVGGVFQGALWQFALFGTPSFTGTHLLVGGKFHNNADRLGTSGTWTSTIYSIGGWFPADDDTGSKIANHLSAQFDYDIGIASGKKIYFASSINEAARTFATGTPYVYYNGTDMETNSTWKAGGYKSSDGTAGATGTITLASITTITVKDGLITAYS